MVTAVCWGVVSVLMIGSIETGLNEISEYREQRDATAEAREEKVQHLSWGVPATQLARSN